MRHGDGGMEMEAWGLGYGNGDGDAVSSERAGGQQWMRVL